MKRYILLLLTVVAIFIGCQNKQQQLEAQQRHDDSLKQATVLQEQEKREAEEKIQAEKANRAKDKETLTHLYASLDADLQAQETRMESIKSFQLLRTTDEKADQVRQQANIINNTKLKMENINEQLQKLENGEEYAIPK